MTQYLFAKTLIKWYEIHKRNLPWRETQNPYFIWLSEILLQQTRVNQGLPYYLNFVKTFPDIRALANAKEKEVLRLWQGLGYYSRARNLHFSAKKLVNENKGKLPDNYAGLIQIKGIGKYTASAIASFAFKEKVAVLDGNVFRVLSRVFGVDSNIASNKGLNEFYTLAESLLPEKDHHIYNQAVMEFGALHCTPANPQCTDCPLAKMCFAKKHKLQASLPVKIKKLKKKTRYFNYMVFSYKDKFMMRERKSNDIWKGLYEFHLIEDDNIKNIDEVMISFDKRNFIVNKESKTFKHILTHQTIFAKFWVIEVKEKKSFEAFFKRENLQTVNEMKINLLPKPVLIKKFLDEYIFV